MVSMTTATKTLLRKTGACGTSEEQISEAADRVDGFVELVESHPLMTMDYSLVNMFLKKKEIGQ